MARYLLIEFDEDQSADTLRAQIDAATQKGRKFRVVGMYQRPSKYCMCSRAVTEYKDWDLQRGAKYGWWVCPTCRRPVVHDQWLKNLMIATDIIQPWSAQGRAFSGSSTPHNAEARQYTFLAPELSLMQWPRGNSGATSPDDLGLPSY